MTDEKRHRSKADVDAWFAAKREKNRQRRDNPVTAADIELRLQMRRDERAGRPSRLFRYLPIAAGIGLLIAAGVLAMATNDATQVFKDQRALMQEQIEVFEGELASFPFVAGDPDADYEAMLRSQLEAAWTAAETVASLQQEYASILFSGNAEHKADGTPQNALALATEHQELLAPLFAEKSLIADKGQGIQDGKIDPRYPWHIGYAADGETVLDPSTSTWEVASVMASTKAGALNVTWFNRTREGVLHAWARATYGAETGKFSQLVVGKTTFGSAVTAAGE